MNLPDRVQLRSNLLSKELCAQLFEEFENIHPARWVKRTELQVGRGVSNLSCSYSCALNKTLGVDYLQRLAALAPEMPGAKVVEIVVNRYEVGDYIPDHRDRAHYKYNMVIAVQECGDGIQILDTFYPDVAGRACIFEGIGPTHSVPPVKHKRYVLIYLYE